MNGREWERNWKFTSNHFVTFIRQGYWKPLPADEFNSQTIQNHLDDDVWVFNGQKLLQKSGKDALNNICWRELGREFILRIHRGNNEDVTDADWQATFSNEGRDNNRDFFAKADLYSSSLPIFNLIQDFANAEESESEEYEKALSQIYEGLGIQRSRLQDVVDLLQMFLPLDIQLQLNGPDVSGCKKEAALLDGKLPTIATLLGRITRHRIALEQLQSVTAEAGNGDSLALVRKLMKHVELVGESDKRSDMSAIFGVKPQSSAGLENNPRNSDIEGFHSTYERLRDTLLDLAEHD
jgi:hypothetical protein